MIYLYRRYSELDKCLQFQIVNDDFDNWPPSLIQQQNINHYHQWVWFYLGQKLLTFPDLRIYPFKIKHGEKNFLIGKWSGTRHARNTAWRIGNKIISTVKHYKETRNDTATRTV